MLIILVSYQLVANAVDALLSGAPQGGAVKTEKCVCSEIMQQIPHIAWSILKSSRIQGTLISLSPPIFKKTA